MKLLKTLILLAISFSSFGQDFNFTKIDNKTEIDFTVNVLGKKTKPTNDLCYEARILNPRITAIYSSSGNRYHGNDLIVDINELKKNGIDITSSELESLRFPIQLKPDEVNINVTGSITFENYTMNAKGMVSNYANYICVERNDRNYDKILTEVLDDNTGINAKTNASIKTAKKFITQTNTSIKIDEITYINRPRNSLVYKAKAIIYFIENQQGSKSHNTSDQQTDSNNGVSGNVNNNYNTTTNNNHSTSQNSKKLPHEKSWEESQRKIEESSRQYEQKQEVINNIADAAGELTSVLIQSGIFKSNPHAKARRLAKRNHIEIISDFNNGLAVAKKGFDKGGLTIGGARYGFIDEKGEIIIPPTYGNARSFSEGLAPVKVGITSISKWCFINEQGKIVIPKNYNDAYPFIDGEALVRVNKKYHKINKKGEVITTFKYQKAAANLFLQHKFPNLILVKQENKLGWIDESGKIVIPIQYKDAVDHPSYPGLARVKYNGKRVFINNKGVIVKGGHNTKSEFSEPVFNAIWNNSTNLNILAWHIYEEHNETEIISKGIYLIKRSIELEENYHNLDTYAHLLFKNKQYNEAYTLINYAVNVSKKSNTYNSKISKSSKRLIKNILGKEPSLRN